MFSSKTKNPDYEGVYDVSPDEISRASLDTLTLIDVREPSEFIGELGHVRDSRLIVLQSLPEHLEELPKDKPIVFVCRSGARSARAAAFAQANGLPESYNMKGGMILWNSMGLPVATENKPEKKPEET